ncbi:MAG: rhomboid family intramembrane serine protease [Salinigranum sp.]
MVAIPQWLPVQQLFVGCAFAVAALAAWWFDRPRGRWGAALRRRFLVGVPWGTLVSVLGVLAFYLFVQDGLHHWYAPVVIPYRAWSYFYPLGMLSASFAHVSPNHITGNLVGALTFGPLAEYAFGHFPRERGSTSFGSLRSNPYVRAFVFFPGLVVAVGLLTSAFAIGPVIGFSSVVFAAAGAALVFYPFATVLAVVAGRVLDLVYSGLVEPRLVVEAKPSFSSPWWAQIAIQGHVMGLLIGVVLGVWLARRRGDDRPPSLRLLTGAVLFTVTESLWAIYWFRGNQTYVLFRAAGTALIVLLSTLVVLAVDASDRPLLPSRKPGTLGSAARWQAGIAVLLIVLAGITGPAIPYNLTTVGDQKLPGRSMAVRDYEVTYAENVPNGLTAAFDVSLFGETTEVNTSGVIVRSPARDIWTTAVSKRKLAFDGRAAVRLGGPTWRDRVVAVRRGWTVLGGNTTYRVSLRHGDQSIPTYTAPPARAALRLGGRNVSVAANRSRFLIEVGGDGGVVAAPIPPKNGSVTLDNVTFVHNGTDVFAEYRDTKVRVASKEKYKGQQ